MKPSWTKDNNGNIYIRFPNWHEILCILKDGGAGYGQTQEEALAWAKHARAHEQTQLSPFTMNDNPEFPFHPSNFTLQTFSGGKHEVSDL